MVIKDVVTLLAMVERIAEVELGMPMAIKKQPLMMTQVVEDDHKPSMCVLKEDLPMDINHGIIMDLTQQEDLDL